jgi:NADH dehydrogenase
MSPIHVGDVARFFVQSIDMESTHKKIFELGGEIAFSWKELIKIIAEGCGKKKWMIPAPALGVKAIATFLGRFSWFPITADQITMLMEGNVCDATEAYKLFEIQPTPFNTDTLSYLRD